MKTVMSFLDEYSCDKCGKPFTIQEWDRRETPHEVDCPNYDPDDDDEFVECTCDRNYHSGCFDFDNDPHLEGLRPHMIIVIPDHRGPSWNDFYSGGHWTKRKEAKDIARQLVRAYIPPDAELFSGRVDIFVTVYFENRSQDSDNICDKLFIDGLKGWVIPDDDKRFVRWAATRSEVDKKNPRVEIEVRAIDE